MMRVTCWIARAGLALALLGLLLAASACGSGSTGATSATTQAPASMPAPTARSTSATASSAPSTPTPSGSATLTSETTDSLPPTTLLVTTEADLGPSGFEKSATSLSQLAARISSLVGGDGVPVFLPRELPDGYAVADSVPWAPERPLPWSWQSSGPRPGPRAAGYSAFFTDGIYLVRLDVNPAGDLGDVAWTDPSVRGVYGPLSTTTAAGLTTVSVPNDDGVEILVWGGGHVLPQLLALAASVALASP